MKATVFFTIAWSVCHLMACSQSNSSKTLVGGPCEGCEAIHESPVAFSKLNHSLILPDYNDSGTKIHISGTVYKVDGKTPAANVVLYVYHTDQKGIYPTKGDEKGWAKRHGYIRGWVKTNDKGFYELYTLRPAHYPSRNAPEHIHITVKEPDKNEYWLSEYLFDDDPLLNSEERKRYEYRGGDGIIQQQPSADGIAKATRDITLGLNIPNYPK